MVPERFRSMVLIAKLSSVRMIWAHAATNKTVYPVLLRKVMPVTRRATAVARIPRGWMLPRRTIRLSRFP